MIARAAARQLRPIWSPLGRSAASFSGVASLQPPAGRQVLSSATRSFGQRCAALPRVTLPPACGLLSGRCRGLAGAVSTGSAGSPALQDLPVVSASPTAHHSVSALTAQLPVLAPATLRRYVESVNEAQVSKIFGDPKSKTPPSAAHIFYSCGFIEGIFLCINALTLSPLIFETFMPYHLKYTGMIIAWWGGTYWGLYLARFGPAAIGIWSPARLVVGLALMLAGAGGLVLADGVGRLGPWPSYWLLMGAYAGMAVFDLALHNRRMLPPWLLKWKLGISSLIVASLLLGVLKGGYLERNAQRFIYEATA